VTREHVIDLRTLMFNARLEMLTRAGSCYQVVTNGGVPIGQCARYRKLQGDSTCKGFNGPPPPKNVPGHDCNANPPTAIARQYQVGVCH